MRKDIFLLVFKNYLLRISRDIFGVLVFTILPLVIVYILNSIYAHSNKDIAYINGYNMTTTYLSIGMMLLFQLNSGVYLLNYLDADLEKSIKWRLQAAPYPKYGYAFSCLSACLIFNYMQGVLIVIFTSIFMDAYWGNIFITLLVILLISLISQLINIILFFTIKKLSVAEGFAWFFSWIMAALGGLIFELPNNAFFNFIKKYGTPFSLGKTAINSSGFIEKSTYDVVITLTALVVLTSVLSYIVILMGRRKLA